jgi:hypothetical protein
MQFESVQLLAGTASTASSQVERTHDEAVRD